MTELERGDKSVPDDEIFETWDSILLKTSMLGAMVQRAVHCGEVKEPDKFLFIPRGGLFVANVLSRQLGFSSDQVLSMGLSKYEPDDPMQEGEFKYGQMPTEEEVYGQNILLGEEVFDTCETVNEATSILERLGAATVYTAAVHYKPGRKIIPDFEPDFCVQRTNGWVHYPWETIDPIGSLHKQIMNNQTDTAEI